MKRYTIMIILCTLLLTGCDGQTNGWQTGDVTLVKAVGVDGAGSRVRLSAFGEECLTADGASVADGIRNLRSAGESFVHFGHVEQMVLDEAFALSGVEQLLDFVARDRQIGPGVRLWVLKDGTSEQMMTACADLPGRLAHLSRERGGGAQKLDCTATRLMRVMAREGSAALPALSLEGEQLSPAGYAVLRQGRLVGFLEGEQALGLELLCAEGAGQLLEIMLGEERIFLRVDRASVCCEPMTASGGLPGLRLRCDARLSPVQGAPLTAQQREQAVRQAELALCGRMAAALGCAQLWDADFAGLEQMAQAACSEQERMELEKDFRALPLQVAAEAWVRWPADMMEE